MLWIYQGKCLSLVSKDWHQKHCKYHEQSKAVDARRSHQDGILVGELKPYF